MMSSTAACRAPSREEGRNVSSLSVDDVLAIRRADGSVWVLGPQLYGSYGNEPLEVRYTEHARVKFSTPYLLTA